MTSRSLRPSSAQSRTAWGDGLDYSSGHGLPDNHFDFGPDGDPDLTTAMEGEFVEGERHDPQKNKSLTSSQQSTSCCGKIGRFIRCE